MRVSCIAIYSSLPRPTGQARENVTIPLRASITARRRRCRRRARQEFMTSIGNDSKATLIQNLPSVYRISCHPTRSRLVLALLNREGRERLSGSWSLITLTQRMHVLSSTIIMHGGTPRLNSLLGCVKDARTTVEVIESKPEAAESIYSTAQTAGSDRNAGM